MSRPCGATNAPGTCLWCGRKLRMVYHTEKERTDAVRPPSKCHFCGSRKGFTPLEDRRFECKGCYAEVYGDHVYHVVKRTPFYDKPGPRGDGLFCTLECGYNFAVCHAENGRRLERNK